MDNPRITYLIPLHVDIGALRRIVSLWFRAKTQWRTTEAPAITYRAMKLIADLKAEHLDENQILEPVFKRGLMHWAHSEQLLLACLADHDADVRGRAVARIIQLRHESEEPPRKRGRPTASGLCVFQLPKPNWEATHYSNMIDWKAEQVYEPPYASFPRSRSENSRNHRLFSMCLQTHNMSRGV